MRHNKGFNHLGRKSAHRKAMLSNMATSLIIHKRIKTTVAKAKALRNYVEPLITKSKEDTTHSRRVVFSYLQNKESVSELFREVAVKVGSRPGGYTRIIKTGNRLGDNAEMCIIELVDYNELMLAEKEASTKTAKRTRRRSKKKTSEVSTEKPVGDETKEAASTEEVKTNKVEEKVVEDSSKEDKVEDTKNEVEEVKETKEAKEEPKEEPKPEAKAEVKKEAKSEEKEEVKKTDKKDEESKEN